MSTLLVLIATAPRVDPRTSQLPALCRVSRWPVWPPPVRSVWPPPSVRAVVTESDPDQQTSRVLPEQQHCDLDEQCGQFGRLLRGQFGRPRCDQFGRLHTEHLPRPVTTLCGGSARPTARLENNGPRGAN